jgi:hypothetical protein
VNALHRSHPATPHQVPAPFGALAVRSDEPRHAMKARAPYGQVHCVRTTLLDGATLTALRAQGSGRVPLAAFSDVEYAPTSLEELAATAPALRGLQNELARALQHTGVLGPRLEPYLRTLTTRIDYLACCGAGFHNDVTRHWPACLFWVLALDVHDVEFVMPHAALRIPLQVGDLLVFDQTMAHGLCRPLDAGQAKAESFETGPHPHQLFLTGEIAVPDAQWAALGSPWLPLPTFELRRALDLRLAQFDERSGAIQRLHTLTHSFRA